MVCTYALCFFLVKKNLKEVIISKKIYCDIVQITGCGITRDELVLLGEKYSKPELLLFICMSFPVFLLMVLFLSFYFALLQAMQHKEMIFWMFILFTYARCRIWSY